MQLLFNERGVISLAAQSVHFMIRRGLNQWHTVHPSITRLTCMVFLEKRATILVAGSQETMLKLDLAKGTVIDEFDTNSEYVMLKAGKYICAATSSGSVDLLDPGTLQVIKTWQAHSASISDLQVSANSLVTCGRALRPHGPAMLESLAKVYDMKSMQQLAPIPFPTGAAYVQIHPKLSTTCVLGAPNGQLQVIDLVNHNTSNIVMLGNYVTHFSISGSGNIWAIADENNQVHLWGSPNKTINFNDNVQLPEYADGDDQVQYMGVDDDV